MGRKSQLEALASFRSAAPGGLAVHLVANGVRGDSRVIKSAQTTMDMGIPTLVLGITVDEQPEAFQIEGVTVVLVPHSSRISADEGRALEAEWNRSRRWIEARRRLWRLRGRRPRQDRVPRWWSERPSVLDINVAFVRALQVLEPTAIHVHDTVPLPAAVATSARSRLLSRRAVHVLYDSHECVPELAVSYPDVPVYRALVAIEREFIHDCAAVITVSPEIAALLRDEYLLSSLPGVVTNAPSEHRDATAPDLRDVVGLPSEVPLAVYSGWIATERGLGTVVRALPSLPELHLAIVCNSHNKAVVAIVRLARELGVDDRVHFAPYVRPAQITQYLASATLGLIPLKRGRHLELSLPTKFREYLHARLPLVVSDNQAMADEVNRTRVGRVFRAGNVAGLALQISRIIEDPDRYRRRITPALLSDHSWERQQEALRRTYRSMFPVTARGTQPEFTALLDAWTRPAPDPDPLLAQPHRVDVALAVGRANSAGQARAWAGVAQDHLRVKAESFAPSRALCRDPHRVVAGRRAMTVPRATAEIATLVGNYTHILVDGFEPLFGDLLGDDVESDLALLHRHRIRTGLIAHGSDVRDPDAHVRRVPHSYFLTAPEEWVDVLRTSSARHREIAARFDGPLFVSTPDLLLDLPRATWLPVVVDVVDWKAPLVNTIGPLRVLHRPSRSEPPIKGTQYVMPILEKLQDEGVVSIIAPEGEVAAAEMPALVAASDLVVDQILTGSYGVAAVEAMAAGRAVVGNVAADTRALLEDDLPVVDATPETLEGVIRDLADDRQRLLHLAEAGTDYASRWHDGRKSAEVLAAFVDGHAR